MIIVLFSFLMICNSSPIDEVVLEYHNATTKEKERLFIKEYQKKKEASIQAYVVSLQMKQAKYKWLPSDKIRVFNTYKNKLDSLIVQHPKNIHLRYVRLVIQEKIPEFLNYHSKIENDKEFLKQKLQVKDNTDYLDTYIIKNTSL